MAEDVIGWLDDLGERRVHLVGHDWGAVISYAAAALAPERFASLTSIAIPHPRGLVRSAALLRVPQQFRKSWYIGLFQLPAVAEHLVSRNDFRLIEKLWSTWSPGWAPPPTELALIKANLARPGVLQATLAYYRALPKTSRAGRQSLALLFQKISVPTLAITGALDGCMDTRLYDRAMHPRDYAGGLSVERIEGAGHFVHQERPEDVNRLLLAWLKRA